MATYIDLDFADGSYRFALGIEQIDEIQKKCGCGIGEVFARVLSGTHRNGQDLVLAPAHARYRREDLHETIRQGLIGGGRGEVDDKEVVVKPADANRLLKNYVLNRPLTEAWDLAFAVLGACVMGFEPPSGNGEAAAANAPAADQSEQTDS